VEEIVHVEEGEVGLNESLENYEKREAPAQSYELLQRPNDG